MVSELGSTRIDSALWLALSGYEKNLRRQFLELNDLFLLLCLHHQCHLAHLILHQDLDLKLIAHLHPPATTNVISARMAPPMTANNQDCRCCESFQRSKGVDMAGVEPAFLSDPEDSGAATGRVHLLF